MLKDVIILGKSTTGNSCPFDSDEVWGVNNVAEHPNFAGCIPDITVTNPGTGYTQAVVAIVGGQGQGVQATPVIENGSIKSITVTKGGIGFTSAPNVVIEGNGVGAQAVATVWTKKPIHKLFAFDLLDENYTNGMKRFAPICSWQPYKDIDYPLQEIIDSFNTKYFTNTVSYMVAYAAYLKIPRIRVYGVDVTFGAPYAQENRGVEYWLGRAEERGCKIEVPSDSHLLRTVSGSMYGVPDQCNIMLYLHERVNLINMLPKQGTYTESLLASNAHWVLMPKSDEAEAHKVVVNRMPDGAINFQCPQEFLSDVHMPPQTWDYLRKLLMEAEKEKRLPFGVISAYEKLILSKPEGGN